MDGYLLMLSLNMGPKSFVHRGEKAGAARCLSALHDFN